MTEENIPYRGDVDHGVPHAHIESTDEAHYWTGRPVEYEPEEREIEPVPVRIVSAGSRENRAARAVSIVLPAGQPVQVLGRDDKRKSATLAMSADNLANPSQTGWITLMPRATYTAAAGITEGPEIPVPPGSTVWVMSRVYAIAGAGATVQGSVLDVDSGSAFSTIVSVAAQTAANTGRSSLSPQTTATGSVKGRLTWSGTVDSAEVALMAYVQPPNGYVPNAPVYLSGDQSVSALNGAKVSAGSSISTDATEPVWAYAPNGGTLNLFISYVQEVK